MKKNGFTLIELLITVAIIGILAAAATAAYIGSIKKAARSEAFTNLDALRLLEEAYFADRAAYAPIAGGTLTGATLQLAIVAIRTELPGFRPDPNGSFNYAVINTNTALPVTPTIPYNGATVAQNPCFRAIATGIAGTRVAGDVFAIDCNNNKNY